MRAFHGETDREGEGGGQKPRIGTGFRVGRLTVAASTAQRRSGYMVWSCRCDCGGEILLDTRCLQRGSVADCGCTTRIKPGRRDITGMRFGRLTAENPTGEVRSGSAVWQCRCDCGGRICAPLHQLTSGYRKSCGCLSRPGKKDYIGKKFGRLTVAEYVGKRNGMHQWKCVCDCGKETVVSQTLLQTGKTKSCGCLQAEVYRDNLKLIDGTSVTILETRKNKLSAANTSGHTGIYRRYGKWVAQISFKGKTYYLGAYEEREEAIIARRKGEKMHDEFLRWYHDCMDGSGKPAEGGGG